MYGSIRKRGGPAGLRKARFKASTCFGIKASGLLTLLFLLNGCSHFNKKTSNKLLANLCLSGSGKGRIQYINSTYVFSYENLLNLKKNDWLLALSMPLHGEELLTLGYNESDKSKIRVKGKFFKRMVYAAHKEKKINEINRLKKILLKVGVFLKFVDSVRTESFSCDEGKICKMGAEQQFLFSQSHDELKFEFAFDADHDFLIEAKANSSYYRKINFILLDKKRRRDARQPFELSLIHRECTESDAMTTKNP